jgi:hypothetical protein
MMFEGLAARLAASVVLGKVKSAWGAIPPKVRLYALIALAVIAAGLAHHFYAKHQLHAQYQLGYDAGYAQAVKDDQKKIDAANAAARAWKTKADASNMKVTTEERGHYDDKASHNRAVADAIRVRIRAKSQPQNGSSPALPHFAAAGGAAGGPQPQANAGLAGEAATICVNAEELVTYAQNADDDHDARVTVEDQWKRLQINWPRDNKP